VRAALVNAVDQEVAAEAMSRTPTEKQLKDFYEQHKAKYSTEGIMLVHDLVPANGVIIPAEAVEALRQGKALTEVLLKSGLKESGRVKDDEFYFAAKIHLGDSLYDAALKLDNGEIAYPVTVDGIQHLLVMERNRRPVALDFVKARAEVSSDYLKDVAKRAQAGEEEFLARRATIRVAPEYQK
jgi:hypothetical protein